ncbi:MAG: hypothetical protein V4568_17090 [Pseudomonadota bacterium]
MQCAPNKPSAAVWIGNFDGEANPAFIGLQAAAPLFFQIVDGIAAEHQELAQPIIFMPKNLARVEVCAASGDLPYADCPRTAMTWFVPGKSPVHMSQIYCSVAIDICTGLQACPFFDPTHTRFEVYEFWPSDMQKLFLEAGMPGRAPPAKLPACGTLQEAGAALKITLPLRSVRYILRIQKLGTESIRLRVVTDGDATDVFWFVDNSFLVELRGGAIHQEPNSPSF